MSKIQQSPIPQMPSDALEACRLPVPEELVRQRVGWTDRQGREQIVDYVEWHTVADLLDERAPGWMHKITNQCAYGDIFVTTVELTIEGVSREGVGTGPVYNEQGIKKSASDALKRAAAMFGIARELYKKDEEHEAAPARTTPAAQAQAPVYRPQFPSQGNTQQADRPIPVNPVAQDISDMASPKQHAAIFAICNALGIDKEAECQTLLNCKLSEISRRGASAFIDYLKKKQA